MAERLYKKYVDILTDCHMGINSGIDPILLPKNQASFAINGTFRGGFATDRAPVQKLVLNFGGDTALETTVRRGFFQGAAPAGYRPDFGPSQNVAQINGRLFTFTPNGPVWDVAEITIPGDPNDATTSQVWMRQAEKWLIISDGTAKLPIFYDGVSCRRSYGPSALLASTTAAAYSHAKPSDVGIGGILTVVLTAPYTGPFDVPVNFNNAYYQVKETTAVPGAYRATLTNFGDTAGATVTTGTPIMVKQNTNGVVTTPQLLPSAADATPHNVLISVGNISCPTGGGVITTELVYVLPSYGAASIPQGTTPYYIPAASTINIGISQAFAGSLGDTVAIPMQQPLTTINGAVTTNVTIFRNGFWTVTAISADRLTLSLRMEARFNGADQYDYPGGETLHGLASASCTLVSERRAVIPTGPFQIVYGSGISFSSGSEPQAEVGTLSADFIVPAQNASVLVEISNAYTGPANQTVWINDKKYSISQAPPLLPSTTLSLVNLNDTSSVNYVPPLDIYSVAEIPACRMGAYGLGQQWFSAVDGLSFGMSDLVGSSAGTPANNYRDAVLKTTDLQVTGYFPLPNAGEIITAMVFVATLDQALGQGPLQIGVASGMFSVKAPFTLIDFQGTPNLTAGIPNPIVTKSLIGYGPIAQNSTILSNSDTIFRSPEGVGSLILARRDFSDIGGNTPISREMTRTIQNDNLSLLSYGSAITFDNRLRMTCAPAVSSYGVFHQGELVLNYDLISSLRGKAQPVWDGLWTGLNILQYAQGMFGPVSRAFSFTFNLTDQQIELYELLPTGTEHFDNGDERIVWVVETPVLFNSSVKVLTELVRLIDGEMYVSDVNGRVDFTVEYRPLFYPCWRPWHTFSICADMEPTNAQEQVRYALGFGEPDPKDCDPINNQPFRDALGFQLRITVTGHCKIWAIKCMAEEQPTPKFTKPAGCVPLCLDV